VNGHVDTCHGGFLSVVPDEMLGNVAEHEKLVGRSTMTAYCMLVQETGSYAGLCFGQSWVGEEGGKEDLG
jgi:hypothetical protein